MAKESQSEKVRRGPENGAHTGGDRLRVQALAKGLAVLQLFDALQPEWSVDEIAVETGFSKMIVYRLIKTMEEAGYLAVDAATNRYHLGPALWAANHVSTQRCGDLVRFARPYLENLAERTKETVTLAVEVDGAAVEVDSIASSLPFRRAFAPGRVIGHVATAHGKVFAAFSPAETQDAILAAPLERSTLNSISDPERLAAELRRVREEGVAFDLEERFVGTCAVAAPVRDQMGRVIASIALIAPPGRFGEAERLAHAEVVKDIAASLSAFMGCSSANGSGPSA